MDNNATDIHLVNERRLAQLEVHVRTIRDDMDAVKETLFDLANEFKEFKGEVRASRTSNGNSGLAKALDVMRLVIIALLSALFTLVGVKYDGGG